jgi:hypothetical protein
MKNSSKPVSASTEGEVVYNGMKPAYPTNARMFSDAQGMSKREAFAMAAMQAYLSGGAPQEAKEPDHEYHERVAKISVWAADGLLKQLES